MNEPKAFASLSSGLLARKGAAKPAMRPQGFGQMGASLEDLGWNDMGFEAPKPAVATQERDATHDAFGDTFAEAPLRSPVSALTPSPVHNQQAQIAERFAAQEDEEDEVELAEADDQSDDQSDETSDPLAPLAEALHVAEAEVEVVEAEPLAEPEPAPLVLSLKPRAPEAVVAPIVRAPVQRAAKGSGPKAAFTLRLDAARHLRLRLACALTGRSAQMLVTDAVDALLNDYPELETFAGGLPEGGQARRARG